MGRIRGQRNRDQDRFHHLRRKQTQAGMVGASCVAFCTNCKLATPSSEVVHGWCLRCTTAWRDTADPVMLAQAAEGYAPAACLSAPTDDVVGRILEFVATPKVDKEYLTLLLYSGRGTVGRMQSLWNFCKTMELLELRTTAEVLKLTKASHDLVHRCGLHAPVQRTTLDSYFARILHSNEFKPAQRDKRLVDYILAHVLAPLLWNALRHERVNEHDVEMILRRFLPHERPDLGERLILQLGNHAPLARRLPVGDLADAAEREQPKAVLARERLHLLMPHVEEMDEDIFDVYRSEVAGRYGRA